MASNREMTCIICPNGCPLLVAIPADGLPEVRGALCKKGIEYAQAELLNPMRTLTTTVKVIGGELPLAPVRTTKPIPKALMLEAARVLSKVEVAAPVVFHQVIVVDLLGMKVDVVATRKIELFDTNGEQVQRPAPPTPGKKL